MSNPYNDYKVPYFKAFGSLGGTPIIEVFDYVDTINDYHAIFCAQSIIAQFSGYAWGYHTPLGNIDTALNPYDLEQWPVCHLIDCIDVCKAYVDAHKGDNEIVASDAVLICGYWFLLDTINLLYKSLTDYMD